MTDSSKIIASIYEIQQEIGAGGGGVVYLARHLRLDKLVILKADKRGLSADMEKLRREADALKSLGHTYIPQVYDFVTDEGNVFTVMDYIEGESFDKPLKRGERFSQPQTVKWLRQLLEAVCYLHSRPPYGILHSDIKPANVMLTPTGDICLIDFNIALALGAGGAVAVGASRGYASPEHYGPESLTEATGRKVTVVDADKTLPMTGLEDTALMSSGGSSSNSKTMLLDVRSDVYSLGATVYHILSGKRPANKARDVVPLSKKEFSPAIVDIITKAMNPDPELRYQSAADMLAAVKTLHKNDPRSKRFVRECYISVIVLAVLFLAGGFSTFTGLKRMEQTQSALTLAEYSANALADGNTALAVDYALSALPLTQDIFTPPAPQAQKALADALSVYDLADGYKATGSVELPSPPLKIVISPSGTLAAAVYAYEIALFEPESAQIVTRLPTAKSALADVEFVNDSLLVYAGENGICAYDTAQGRQLWQGKPATEIAVSAGGEKIVAVNKDAAEAIIYAIDGGEKTVISFEGKHQRIPVNDTFGNPSDNLLSLNRDGSLLAVSFADGSLDVFDIPGKDVIPVQSASAFTHFEGGFNGDYFALSAMGENIKSVFALYNMQNLAYIGGFESDDPFFTQASEKGVFLSSGNLVIELNPETGEQKEIGYTDKAIISYMRGGRGVIAATSDNAFHLFDENANLIDSFSGENLFSFVSVAGDIALAGGRDSPSIRILRREDFSAADVFAYDPAYPHDEARINDAHNRVMLFSYKSFRLYDMNGSVLSDVSIPDSELVHDQQYSPASGNLVVMYKNALRIYSGENGNLLLEKEGLQSTFYAPYGVSILEQGGTVSLIDVDTAKPIRETKTDGSFAAICGVTVDSAFLGNRELIGTAQINDGYLFAVRDGVKGAVYNGDGEELFLFDANGKSEAFFVGNVVVISPLHGTPAAYSIKTGKKIRELEPNSYMTYMTKSGDYIVSEYISSDGARFGVLLDANYEILARLPGLTDIKGSTLFFDYKTGYIRQTQIYSIDELKRLTEGG